MVARVWTVGHSNHEADAFVELLKAHDISAVGDVRSEPYSRHAQHFCKNDLLTLLAAAGIKYVFLGRELGGRCEDAALRTDGRLDFAKLARSASFQAGIARVESGASAHRIALLCAEHDPIHCHRSILVCRQLSSLDLDVRHIHQDGRVESQAALERRLLQVHGLADEDLFTPYEVRLERAYERQAEQVAWRPPGA